MQAGESSTSSSAVSADEVKQLRDTIAALNAQNEALSKAAASAGSDDHDSLKRLYDTALQRIRAFEQANKLLSEEVAAIRDSYQQLKRQNSELRDTLNK